MAAAEGRFSTGGNGDNRGEREFFIGAQESRKDLASFLYS
jgi:hypothetical protein